MDNPSVEDGCVDVVSAEAERGVGGVGPFFLMISCISPNIIDDEAVPHHFQVPASLIPSLSPRPPGSGRARQRQHRQELKNSIFCGNR